MNTFKLSAVALCLTSALMGCNNDGSGFVSNAEPVESSSSTSAGQSAFRGIVSDTGTTIVAIGGVDVPGGEQVTNLIDGTSATKFLTFSDSAQVIVITPKAYKITGYKLTSANDAPERDPTDWSLEGSTDGENWQVIDEQSGESFSGLLTTNDYEVNEDTAEYTQFRFSLSHAAGVGILQFSELELIVKAEAPLTEFSSTVMTPEVNQIVIFHDDSLVNPTSWQWTFEGGTPATSTEKNPLVRFDALGAKTVTLVATNDKGSTTLVKEHMIRVWDPMQPWLGFPKPLVTFNKTLPEHVGQAALERVMPDLEAVIHEISLGVAKVLFNNVTEINIFETLNFETGEYDFPAAKSGTDKDMILMFDLNHLANIAQQGDDALRDEVLGVLWHELTHGYNNSPNSGVYQAGNEYHTYLEALGNYSRIQAGFHESRRANIKWVDSWNDDAYEQTSFFLEWLQNGNLGADFIKKFNQQAGLLSTWSFDAAFKAIFGESYGIEQAWAGYQQHLTLDLGISPPYPTPVDGFKNVAIDADVVVTFDGTDLSPFGIGQFTNINDNNINTPLISVLTQPAWWPDALPPVETKETASVTFELPQSINITKYSITVGTDHLKWNPSNWVVSASNDNETWTQLDTNAYPEPNNKLDTFIFDIEENEAEFGFYRFTFANGRIGEGIGGDNGVLLQIGEIALLAQD